MIANIFFAAVLQGGDAVPASLITPGAFPAGNFTVNGNIVVTGSVTGGAASFTTVVINSVASFSATPILAANIVFTAATAQIQPGATGINFTNNAVTQNNLTIADSGAVGIRGILSATLQVQLANATATPAGLVDGQLWYDGTNLRCRLGGATKTITAV